MEYWIMRTALITFGYLSLAGEVVYSKFIFNISKHCIANSYQSLSQSQLSDTVLNIFTGIISGLNLISALTVISPVKNTNELFDFLNTTKFKKKKFLLLPIFFMLVNFFIGAFAAWLGIIDILSFSKIANDTIGLALTQTTFCYYILFCGKDVLNNALYFSKINKIIIKLLFLESKSIFFAALFKFLISATYRAMTYGFIGGLVFNKIFDLPKYEVIGKTAGIISSLGVSTLTRLSVFQDAIMPFMINDLTLEYDLQLLDPTINLAKNAIRKTELIKPFILSILHGVGVGIIIFCCVNLVTQNFIVKITLSAAIGLLAFLHLFFADQKLITQHLARKYYNENTEGYINFNNTQYTKKHYIIAQALNISARTAASILSLFSLSQLLKNFMGDDLALLFGFSIVTRVFCTELQYRQSKILSRVTELEKNMFNFYHTFLQKKPAQTELEIPWIIPLPINIH